ncbi:MAG: cytidylate kinase-like family protein [Elusimicrobia bacterium]|nr:cytidylate kinase-like family protein [Elusimicrobiota bacterium]
MEGERLLRYLRSAAEGERERRREEEGRGAFVTISRQSGAGGRTAARAIVAALEREQEAVWRGWRVYDRELCERLLEDSRLRVSLEALRNEEYLTPLGDLAAQLVAGDTPQEVVVWRLFKLVRSVAGAGKAVILGRAGCLACHGMPAGVHIRLVAPLETRAVRLAPGAGGDHAESERRARVQDEGRRRLFASRFRKDIDDPYLYDAVINTGSCSPEEVAAQVVSLLKSRRTRSLASLGAVR